MLGNEIHTNVDALNLLGKNELSHRLTRCLFLIQEHNVHLNHIEGASNLFADALSRMPLLDDTDAYDCDNKIPCAKFHFAIDNETSASKQNLTLDLVNIAGTQLNDPCCAHARSRCGHSPLKDINQETTPWDIVKIKKNLLLHLTHTL